MQKIASDLNYLKNRHGKIKNKCRKSCDIYQSSVTGKWEMWGPHKDAAVQSGILG